MLTVTIAGVLLLAGTGPSADAIAALQPPPSFSGHWVLTSVSPEREGYDNFWLGREATIAQDAARMTITRVDPAPQREAAFNFGRESRNEYVFNGQRQIRDSRTSIGGGSLLISTDTTTPDGQRWLSNISRWSLDPDGTLIVGDTEICGRGECPSVITTLKFTRKR
jgi:hypothetical protein